ASARLDALHDCRRCRIPDQLDLNPETRRKCISDLYDHSPRVLAAYLTGYWIFGVLREKQRDRSLPERTRSAIRGSAACWASLFFMAVRFQIRWIWNS